MSKVDIALASATITARIQSHIGIIGLRGGVGVAFARAFCHNAQGTSIAS